MMRRKYSSVRSRTLTRRDYNLYVVLHKHNAREFRQSYMTTVYETESEARQAAERKMDGTTNMEYYVASITGKYVRPVLHQYIPNPKE